MNNEEQLNNIMGVVEVFLQMNNMNLSSNSSYIVRTEVFNNFELDYYTKENPKLVEKFYYIQRKIDKFPTILESFTKEINFIDKWKDMSIEEKTYILSFDKTSYSIIRKVLSAEDTYLENWDECLGNINININDAFINELKLPLDFLKIPKNGKQLKPLFKKLIQLGYDKKYVSDYFGNNGDAFEFYTQKLIRIAYHDQTSLGINSLLKTTTFTFSDSMNHKMVFFINQEKDFQQILFVENLITNLEESGNNIKKKKSKI